MERDGHPNSNTFAHSTSSLVQTYYQSSLAVETNRIKMNQNRHNLIQRGYYEQKHLSKKK
ncbi:hypothetical protein RHGRI_000466 [Rhododendron griersonianum]|uniref:Uncharacterized protein n=1 Tax=Rhododendron griersonianum TaxID=479676 RepID=A0AAV6LJ13_9ERIC|nr:hypothetical protein RHGRI_000466 [Rhododendron griersonianum]